MRRSLRTLKQFATHYHLTVRDDFISGRRGILFFDSAKLCLSMFDTRPLKRSRLDRLICGRTAVVRSGHSTGSIWQGDISLKNGRRVQDIEIRGIVPEKYEAAIRLASVRKQRVLSDTQRAASIARLATARASSPVGCRGPREKS